MHLDGAAAPEPHGADASLVQMLQINIALKCLLQLANILTIPQLVSLRPTPAPGVTA